MSIKECLSDAKTIEFPFPASTAVEIGTLLWDNAGVAAKASAQADQLTQPLNQRLFAERFLGIAKDKRLSTETSTGNDSKRVIVADGEFDCTCASTTWAVGDLVGAVEASNGTELEDVVVAKVTDWSLAIGICLKAATSATAVRCHLVSRKVPNTVPRLLLRKLAETATADTATITANQLRAGILAAIPTGAATYTLPTAALLVAAFPGVQVGDSFDILITNNSGGANTITVAAGSGGTADGTLTVAQNIVRRFTFVFTNVTSSSEAYTVYGNG